MLTKQPIISGIDTLFDCVIRLLKLLESLKLAQIKESAHLGRNAIFGMSFRIEFIRPCIVFVGNS